MRTGLLAAGLLAALGATLMLSACGSNDSTSSSATLASSRGSQIFAVSLTDKGCEPATIDAHTGPATFAVKNDGAAGVTKFEILDGDRVIGKVEDIITGRNGQFSLNLNAGTYTTYCPGGSDTERGVLKVTGDDPTDSATPALP